MAPFRAITPFRGICLSCRRQNGTLHRQFATSPLLGATQESSLPRVANPSFWSSLIPKPLRRQQALETDPDTPLPAKPRSRFLTRPRDWNPFTIFILLGLLAGSNAIQILTLRNDTLSYTRKTEAKLSVLREVVQKVKNGEEVDVRKALGTGDAEAEAEWEDVMKELETADGFGEGRGKWEEKLRLKEEEKAAAREGGGESRRKKGPKAVIEELERQDEEANAKEGQAKFLM